MLVPLRPDVTKRYHQVVLCRSIFPESKARFLVYTQLLKSKFSREYFFAVALLVAGRKGLKCLHMDADVKINLCIFYLMVSSTEEPFPRNRGLRNNTLERCFSKPRFSYLTKKPYFLNCSCIFNQMSHVEFFTYSTLDRYSFYAR